MEQKLHPDWLTLDFLNQCLQSNESYKTSSATKFTAESAVAPGNNYGSNILRVRLTVREVPRQKEHTLSLIVKCPLIEGAIKEFFDRIYFCESAFYNDFLPLGRKLLNRPFFPDYFQSPIPRVVVLEDLKEKGYLMAERTKQLDFDHCRLYMEAAANFHAMSFAVFKQDPDLIYRLGDEKMYTEDMDESLIIANKNLIKYCLECMSNRVSEYVGNHRIKGILTKCSKSLWEMLVEARRPSKLLNTLNQGDPWTTNMMFKYSEDGRVCDLKLLDFQCVRYGSPVSDLVFFIWSSANRDVLNNNQDRLYEVYLENFNRTLEEMNFKRILTMDMVKKEALKLSPVALWLVAMNVSITLEPSVTDIGSIFTKCKENIPLENNPFEPIYSENFSKNHLPELIHLLDSAGVFDYLESKLK